MPRIQKCPMLLIAKTITVALESESAKVIQIRVKVKT